jgi:hypothetical protein
MFQEGRSSNLWIRRGIWQVAGTRIKSSGKCTGVYCMWVVWATGRRRPRSQKSIPVGWSVRLHWMASRATLRALVMRKYTWHPGWLLSRVLVVSCRTWPYYVTPGHEMRFSTGTVGVTLVCVQGICLNKVKYTCLIFCWPCIVIYQYNRTKKMQSLLSVYYDVASSQSKW